MYRIIKPEKAKRKNISSHLSENTHQKAFAKIKSTRVSLINPKDKTKQNGNDSDMQVDTINLKRQRLEESACDIESIKKMKFSENESINENEMSIIEFNDIKNKTYIWPNGDPQIIFKYEGSYIDNKRSGNGVLFSTEGYRYEGQFEDDKITGKGTFVFPKMLNSKGDFENEFPANGVFTYSNLESYEGEFVDSKFHGQGILKHPNGSSYEGNFLNNIRHGTGTSTYQNGDKYIGEFSYGQKQGRGTYIWANGDKFEGQFPAMNLVMEDDLRSELEVQSEATQIENFRFQREGL